MEYMVEMHEVTIYPRDCFSCGKQMVPVEKNSTDVIPAENSTDVWCERCDVYEDGTVTGRWTYNPLPFAWGDEIVSFIDHSEVHLPSPALGMTKRAPARSGRGKRVRFMPLL